MKGFAWLVRVAALSALLLAGCGSALAVTHHSHPLIFPTLTPGAARVAPGTTLLTYHVTGSGGITSIVWSPDSQRIATADIIHNKILIWDASTGQTLLTLQAPNFGYMTLAWSPDGKQIAASISYPSSYPSIVDIWDATTGAAVTTLQDAAPGHINALAYSPDSQRLAYASDNATVTIWNISTGQKLYTYQAPGPVKGLAWSRDGSEIASISQNVFQIWNSSDGKLLLVLGSRTPQLTTVAWSPDGQELATGAADGSAQTWDMFALTGKTIATYTSPQGSISALSWSPDSQYLVTASAGTGGGAIQVWEASTGNVILTYNEVGASAVAWSPDGTRIASTAGQNVEVWTAP